MAQPLTLALACTIRHDGNGGVADDLADLAGLTNWLREYADQLRQYIGPLDLAADVPDEEVRRDVVAVRRAVRTLFARAVQPAPPSRADATSLLAPATAVHQLNQAAGRLPVRPVLHWPDDAAPSVTQQTDLADPWLRLTAALARAAIEFLASPAHEQLRACPAPRCVRYFVKSHPRQEWCKTSCGNRARVARHYQRHQSDHAANT
jgi:predicted RNA-binding Zn ribbon-like protein